MQWACPTCGEEELQRQPIRKTKTDRDAQFEYINSKTKQFQGQGQPVISVDTKKKELIGDFKNVGHEWCPKGEPEEVQVYDFKESHEVMVNLIESTTTKKGMKISAEPIVKKRLSISRATR
ncbi:MAG: hypothetical protein IBX40_05830 [Methanosarcinales archaeon]|nr:hypothetical protein [Methanosarcinales archaeon]